MTRVDGYNGNIDGDYSYKDYEKTIKELGLNGFKNTAEKQKTITVTVMVEGKTYTGDLKEQ